MSAQRMKTRWAAALTLLLGGCASIHSGNEGISPVTSATVQSGPYLTASKIYVTGAEIGALSSRYFSVIDFTFENKSSKWVRVERVSLDFGSDLANELIQFPVGEQLAAWADAAQQNREISDANTALVLSSIAALGAVATVGAIPSGNTGVMGVGAATAIGASSALSVKALVDYKHDLEWSRIVPNSHILSPSFVIPPGLHQKKWLTVFTPKPNKTPFATDIVVTLHLAGGKTEAVKVPFREVTLLSPSKWQANHRDNPKNEVHTSAPSIALNQETDADEE